MWNHRIARPTDRVVLASVERGSVPLTFAEALALWEGDAGFRAFHFEVLASMPFDAYRWETPPITSATADRPFEFAVIDSPGLARRADASAFDSQLRRARGGLAVAFDNLGGDAVLVVPRPEPTGDFCHLASFQRTASDALRHALWSTVGAAMRRRLGERPVWLNTAGAGVPWLHIRLDDRPKYYAYEPFTVENQ